MTVPAEEERAINLAREFLYRLTSPKDTPRVPKAVRDEAFRVLKHYPWEGRVTQLYDAYFWWLDAMKSSSLRSKGSKGG